MVGWYSDKAMTVAVMRMMMMMMMVMVYIYASIYWWLYHKQCAILTPLISSQASLVYIYYSETRKQNNIDDVSGGGGAVAAWDCLCVCIVSKWRTYTIHKRVYIPDKKLDHAQKQQQQKLQKKRKITTDVNVIFGVCVLLRSFHVFMFLFNRQIKSFIFFATHSHTLQTLTRTHIACEIIYGWHDVRACVHIYRFVLKLTVPERTNQHMLANTQHTKIYRERDTHTHREKKSKTTKCGVHAIFHIALAP